MACIMVSRICKIALYWLVCSLQVSLNLNMFKNLPGYQVVKKLSVNALSVERQDRWLFRDLNFNLQSGEVLHIAGENGSGKTTLLRILTGITLADEGEVLWGETPIQKNTQAYHMQVCYVGHTNGIKPELTVMENLQVAMVLARSRCQNTGEILEYIGLAGKEEVLAYKLSAGQRQRLAFARCLAHDSSLWILDEPLTALDQGGIKQVEHTIQSHVDRGGMAVVTSHQPLHIQNVSSKTLSLSD